MRHRKLHISSEHDVEFEQRFQIQSRKKRFCGLLFILFLVHFIFFYFGDFSMSEFAEFYLHELLMKQYEIFCTFKLKCWLSNATYRISIGLL